MRFGVSQGDLSDGLRMVGRAVSARNIIPVLSGVHIRAEGEGLQLRATDLELAIGVTIPARVETPGETVLPGRYLTELVRRLPPGEVTVTLNPKGAGATLRWEESEAAVNGLEADQFPTEPAPEPGQSSLTVSCEELRALLRETGFATGHDESRPWFSGIFLTLTGAQLAAMATDGAVVAYSEASVHNPEDAAFSVILPGRSLEELSRLLSYSAQKQCRILPGRSRFSFEIGAVTLTTRLLEGQYPDFRRFLPTEYPSAVLLDREQMMVACERAALVAHLGAIRLDAGPNGLSLSARGPEIGEVTERFRARRRGPAFSAPINVQFVLGGLRSMKSEFLLIEFAGPRQAVRFRWGREARSYFSVLPLLSF